MIITITIIKMMVIVVLFWYCVCPRWAAAAAAASLSSSQLAFQSLMHISCAVFAQTTATTMTMFFRMYSLADQKKMYINFMRTWYQKVHVEAHPNESIQQWEEIEEKIYTYNAKWQRQCRWAKQARIYRMGMSVWIWSNFSIKEQKATCSTTTICENNPYCSLRLAPNRGWWWWWWKMRTIFLHAAREHWARLPACLPFCNNFFLPFEFHISYFCIVASAVCATMPHYY